MPKPQALPKTVNYRGHLYSFDMVLETIDGYFIIKDFKDKVVLPEDLKQLKEVATSKFKVRGSLRETFIFRILCVAKEYDKRFWQQETLEQLMTEELNADFKIDLIVEEKIGFSVLRIDH
jgi:hypothetical protein